MGRKRNQQLSEAQDKELLGCYTQSKNVLVRTRCQAVRLYGQSYTVEEIMKITGCSRTSLMEWWSKYRHLGLPGLDDHRRGGNSAKLTVAQVTDLAERLQIYSPRQLFGRQGGSAAGQFWTVPDLQRAVKQWYGASYQSRSSYHNLFERCGLSYQRSTKVYKSRSEHKVVEFEAVLEKKLLDVAQDHPQTIILTEDEASLYLQATLTAVWAPRRQTPTVPVHPGREKICFYGSLNLKTGQETVWQAETMNSQTTADYLQHLLEVYPEKPILLLWDRAKWHYGQPVRDFLQANSRLEVMYLPPASPDLNPQEHVWKATRKTVSHNHRIQRLAELADQFEDHLVSTTFPASFLDTYGFNNICPMFI